MQACPVPISQHVHRQAPRTAPFHREERGARTRCGGVDNPVRDAARKGSRSTSFRFEQAFADNVAEIDAIAGDRANHVREHNRGAVAAGESRRVAAFSTTRSAVPRQAAGDDAISPRAWPTSMRVYQRQLFRPSSLYKEKAKWVAAWISPVLERISRLCGRAALDAMGRSALLRCPRLAHARHQVQPELLADEQESAVLHS